jgi:hypothetical protein
LLWGWRSSCPVAPAPKCDGLSITPPPNPNAPAAPPTKGTVASASVESTIFGRANERLTRGTGGWRVGLCGGRAAVLAVLRRRDRSTPSAPADDARQRRPTRVTAPRARGASPTPSAAPPRQRRDRQRPVSLRPSQAIGPPAPRRSQLPCVETSRSGGYPWVGRPLPPAPARVCSWHAERCSGLGELGATSPAASRRRHRRVWRND